MQPHPRLPDFDTLMKLSRQDPNAYETFRTQLLADAIADCPPRHQKSMQQVLMRIEMARQAASTPLEALVFATRLMGESMNELNSALHQLQDELANLHGLLVLDRISNNSRGARPRQMRGGETHGT